MDDILRAALLISNNTDTQDQIAAAMPEDWSLSTCASLEAAEDYLTSLETSFQDNLMILWEFDPQSAVSDYILRLRRDGRKALAIISNSTERELCFRAGAVDYLLKPINTMEIKTRLSGAGQQAFNRHLQERVMQLERLASIGRLTSHICHEIINPLQAIGGAMSLALEEADVSKTLKIYINLCQHEAQRVGVLVERMRQLYRPQKRKHRLIHTESAWKEAIAAASEEFDGYRVKVTADFEMDLPAINGDPNQIFLAFLAVLFEASDLMRLKGLDVLTIRGDTLDGFVRFQISMDSHMGRPDENLPKVPYRASSDFPANAFGVSLIENIITAHGGRIEVGDRGHPFVMKIFIPFHLHEDKS
jgi:nitrogen-specific signal transduction histidine kinase